LRRRATWSGHLHAQALAPALRAWLTAPGSLTARLKAHSAEFRVQPLRQHSANCLADEAALIGLPKPRRGWQREVVLKCDGVPVVFAHTVVPLTATAADWPLFGALGERSLGSTLFGDPLVWRGALAYARLGASHPLHRRALAALGLADGALGPSLYARRCLYRRRAGLLLVTEVFLPSVLDLRPAAPDQRTQE